MMFLAVFALMVLSSCAVYGQRGPRPRYSAFDVLDGVVATASLIEQQVTQAEMKYQMMMDRRPVQATSRDVTRYGGPGMNYSREIHWRNASVYANGYRVVFVEFLGNGVRETHFTAGVSHIQEFSVIANDGTPQRIQIISVSGRVDLYYPNGDNRLLAGK